MLSSFTQEYFLSVRDFEIVKRDFSITLKDKQLFKRVKTISFLITCLFFFKKVRRKIRSKEFVSNTQIFYWNPLKVCHKSVPKKRKYKSCYFALKLDQSQRIWANIKVTSCVDKNAVSLSFLHYRRLNIFLLQRDELGPGTQTKLCYVFNTLTVYKGNGL